MDSNLAILTQVASDVLGRYDLELTAETSFAEVPKWDSVALVKMLFLLEAQLGVEFDTYDVANLKKVGDLLAMMEKAQG